MKLYAEKTNYGFCVVDLAPLFPKYLFNNLVTFHKRSPMAFTVQLPTFQVETAKGNHLYSDYQQAYSKYVDYEKNNVPCELYKEGVKQKEYKPSS